MISIGDGGRKNGGEEGEKNMKRTNAIYQYFLLISHCFQKGFCIDFYFMIVWSFLDLPSVIKSPSMQRQKQFCWQLHWWKRSRIQNHLILDCMKTFLICLYWRHLQGTSFISDLQYFFCISNSWNFWQIPLYYIIRQIIIFVLLTLSQASPGFYMPVIQVFWKHCGKRRNCS